MQLKITNGVRKLTATKTEVKALAAGIDVLAAYASINHTDQRAAGAVVTAKVILDFLKGNSEAEEVSEPEGKDA